MAAILKIGIQTPLGILNGFLARSNDLKKKFVTLLVKFITLSGSITLLVDFITLSGSITLSGVYYIIGAKYYISRYSSSFYGGHFGNRYLNANEHIKKILAR